MPSALRYIFQAENIVRNKAFKDVLPANAKEFARKWNTEQVAGRQPPSAFSPKARRALMALRGTLGANIILGNLATTVMQFVSFPQVFAFAGARNTFYGIGKRLRSYLPGQTSLFEESRTKALRNLDIDIGLGDSLIDQALIQIGKLEKIRDPVAKTREAIEFGRTMFRGLMETADQFTVGAAYEAFYRKGVLDGLEPNDAMEFADIMTAKTQANYFKEAIPPFLNTTEGRILAQFGIFGMNQWEMFKNDFGRDFKLDKKSPKSKKKFFRQFITFLGLAYLVDSISEATFGRQPYDIKQLIDETIEFAKGDSSAGRVFDTARETAASYIPFLSSVKFRSMPPVLEFGSDVINATVGTGKPQEKAIKELSEKWSYNILLPYGGNQVRKSLQGVEAITDVDLPFVRNSTGKKFDIEENVDRAKAIIFGPYTTTVAQDFFKDRDRRAFIKDKFNISGPITSNQNIFKLKQMPLEMFQDYTKDYAPRTKETIARKLKEVPETTRELINDLDL